MPNKKESTTVALDYPFPQERVFRYQAMQDVLTLLIEEPYEEFTVSQIATMIDANQATVSKAVPLLKQLGPIQTRRDGRRQYVSIDRDHLTKPDPILSIPQAEFQKPVRAFVDRVQDELDELVGVLLFGSVARGDADRASDIDVMVFVEDERTQARRLVQSVVSDLEETKFDGNRYTFEVLVESTDSAERIGSRLRQQFDDGLTLVGSDDLSALRTEVYADEEQ
jgi:predicted nucleotidyltransferase